MPFENHRASTPDAPVRGVRNLLATSAWALKILWTTNRSTAVGFVLVTLMRASVAAGLALAARGLINAAALELRNGTTQIDPLVWWLAAAAALGFVEALAPLATRLLHARLTDDLSLRVTADILAHAAALDLACFEDPRRREIVDRAQQAPALAVSKFVAEIQSAATDVIQVILLMAVVVKLEPLVLAVGLLAVPYMVFQWNTATRRHSQEISRTLKRRWARYFTSLVTSPGSAAEVKLLGLAPLFLDRFRTLVGRFVAQDARMHRRDFWGGSVFALLTIVAFYATFVRVAARVLGGTLTLGDLAVFAAVGPRLRFGLDRAIVAASSALQQALIIDNLLAFFDMRPMIAASSGAAAVTTPVRGAIDIADVSFTYPGATAPALLGVSLRIGAGETVALVGENGAGKTTLVKLIARLYDPDLGSIAIDGVDARAWPSEALHARIALVPQGATRFEATAAENIAYGRWRALLDDPDAVERIARTAGVDDLIRGLPEGYGTMLGRLFGVHDLSGGQWQKIAVARALARDAPILILDEPAAHLDARAEHDLFCRLGDLARGRTTIIVSHRLATLKLADRIFVMERGRIIESGTHASLVAHGGTYATLYALHRRQVVVE